MERNMKFTFTKYKLKTILKDLITIILVCGMIYWLTLQDLYIGHVSLFAGIIILFKLLHHYYLIIRFLRHHSKEEIKQFEVELSNVLLKYDCCFLTQNYIFIFDLTIFEYVKYDDIICITLDSITHIYSAGKYTLGKKQTIYLKNNKKYIIKTSLFKPTSKFVKLIKKKNNDIFFGDIKEYKKQKDKIEYVKELKERTRI